MINSIRQCWKIPWEIHSLVKDLVENLSVSPFSINHCYREANPATNFMAHQGHDSSSLLYGFNFSNSTFSTIIRKDAIG